MTNVDREVAILHRLRHPRILNLMGVCRDMSPMEGNMGLIFEMMAGGSLFDFLHGMSGNAPLHPSDLMWRLNVCLDIADGMIFLHSSKILHRDLKSANVLMDREGRCKIADFGLSTFKDSTMTQTVGVVATPAWTDPEVIKGAKKHSEASDMYSFGVIVWEVFSGEAPWAGVPVMTIMALTVYEGQRLPIRNSFPVAVRGFLTSAFKESTERPTFSFASGLFQDLINDQLGRRLTNSATIPSEERMKQIVREGLEGAMGDIVLVVDSVVGQHVAPLHEALTKIEGRIIGLKKVFGDMHEEILALNKPEGWSGLSDFWMVRMDRLESLVQSSSCDEGKIVKEMRMIGNLLANQMLELDLKMDPDSVVQELNRACGELVAASSAHNEESISELLEELKRMISTK
jgi:serine/threonine protein kinase